MRPSRRTELEAALQARWDRETLAVYADYLEAIGDPRGPLIAIDLAIEDRGATPELAADRGSALAAWLGELRAATRFGIVEAYYIGGDAELDALFAAPFGEYLHALYVHAPAERIEPLLARLATRAWPWLRRLDLATADRARPARPIATAVMAAVAAATPNLEILDLRADGLVRTPVHPRVTTLRLVGTRGIVVGEAAMPSVTTIELELDRDAARPADLPGLAAMLSPRTFPALRRLDLSRNEYAYPTALASNVGVFPFVLAIEQLERLAELRLPAVRDAVQARDLTRVLDRAPGLAIAIARMYRGGPELDPRVRTPAPRPWWPDDQMSGREALEILDAHGEQLGDELALSPIIDELEARWDTLAEPAREPWLAFWAFFDTLGWEHADGTDIVLPFSAELLERACASLPDDLRCASVVVALRDAQLPPGATVGIKRYWGW
jgi:hypothetical protein